MMFSVLLKLLLAVGQLWAFVVRWLKEEKKWRNVDPLLYNINHILLIYVKLQNQFDINKAWNPLYFQHGEEEICFHS